MGLDAHYQALPASSPFLARLREDPITGEWSNMVPVWIRDGLKPSPWPPEPDELAVRNSVEELIREHPGVSERHCSLGRVWDVLHYLLSANRRDEPGTSDDVLADAAIRGEELVAEHVRGGQGTLMRYTPPETVKRIVHLLESLSFNDLVAYGHPRLMRGAAVYKFSAESSEEEFREWLSPYFETLRAFYRMAASHGDGVLVSLD